MKTLKQNLKTAVAAVLIIATTMLQFQALAGNVKQIKLQKDGNEGGGGGDGTKRRLTTAADVAEVVNGAKLLMGIAFNALEADAINEEQDEDYEVWRKLTKGKDFRQTLNKMEITLQEKPCLHKVSKGTKTKTVKSDGSATLPNKICISTNRLIKRKYSQDEVVSKVGGLIAHEVAHLLGGDENDAKQLQRLIEQTTVVKDMYSALGSILSIEEPLSILRSDWDLYIRNTDERLTKECMAAGIFYARVEALEKTLFNVSDSIIQGELGILRSSDSIRFIDAKIRISNVIANSCGLVGSGDYSTISAPSLGQMLEDKEMTMSEVLQRAYEKRGNEFFGLPPYWDMARDPDGYCADADLGSGYCLQSKQFTYRKLEADEGVAMWSEMKKAHDSLEPVFVTLSLLLEQTDRLINPDDDNLAQ